MTILNKSLNLIDDIINNSSVQNLDFYQNILKMMSSLYENCSLGIFFLENEGYTLKEAIKNNKFVTYVIIDDGVTSLGDYLFNSLLNATTFEIKNAVKI